jgi:hypothetical protein
MKAFVGLTTASLVLFLLLADQALGFGHRTARAPRIQNNIVVGAAPAGGCCGRAPQATIVQRSFAPVQRSYYQQRSFVPVQRDFVPVQRSYVQVQQQQDFVPVERQVVQRSYVPVERTVVQRSYVPVDNTIVQQQYAPATTTCASQAPALDYGSTCTGAGASFAPSSYQSPAYGTADYAPAPGLAPARGVIRHRERTVQRTY